MNDEQMQPLLEVWLHDRDEAPRDASGGLARVMAHLPEVRQRGRWWPLPVFDRPVSTFPSRELAPAPIPATNGRQPARGFTMFSAVKFVVAGVIVALFGGFLLAGVLTTQQDGEVLPGAVTESPSPMTTEDLLSGMVTEEVEPGVFRVINDGVRDLAKANDTDIVAGEDGGIYLLRPQRFVRLGGDEWLAWATERPYVRDFEVAPDGTVWTVQEPPGENNTDPAAIQSFDGEEWATHQEAVGSDVLDVTPDGTVWAFWHDPEQESGPLFGYLDEDGWQTLGHLDSAGQLLVAGPDDIWAVAGPMSEFLKLYRFVDGGWQRWVTLEGTEPTWQPAEEPPEGAALVLPVAVGPDGTFWGVAHAPDFPGSLVRLDGSGWSRWPVEGTGFHAGAGMEVATDGSVWYASGSPADTCGGFARFDGVTPDRYLSGLCVKAIDITADGAVWLLANEPDADLRHVYVITPEAVAATE